MNMSVGECFELAVEADLKRTAHRIYWALLNGKVKAEDDAERLNDIETDWETVDAMDAANLLGIGRIQLFAVKTRTENWFAFYFAEHSLDVHRLHAEKFRETSVTVTNADRLLFRTMACASTGKEAVFIDRRKQYVEFPAYVGHAKAGEGWLYVKRAWN